MTAKTLQGQNPTSMKRPDLSFAPNHFFRGKEGAPVLVPLAGINDDVHALIRFCRRICPVASVLAFDLDRFADPFLALRSQPEPNFVGWLAEVLRTALKTYDVSLAPVIIVGHATGADLGVAFTLKHGLLLSAAILLRPSARSKIMPLGVLDELPVLLGHLVTQEAAGTAGWQLRRVLLAAGAQVICERIPYRKSPGGRETALARVFIASLFGDFP